MVDETARGRMVAEGEGNKELVDFDDDDDDEDEVVAAEGADITATLPPADGGGEVKAEEEHAPTAGLSRGALRVSESGAPPAVVGESLRRVGEPRQRAASGSSSTPTGRLLPNEVRSAMPTGVRPRAVCGA